VSTPSPVDREALRLGAFVPPWLLPLDIDPTRAIRGQLEAGEGRRREGDPRALPAGYTGFVRPSSDGSSSGSPT
jgi:hypothetical protein